MPKNAPSKPQRKAPERATSKVAKDRKAARDASKQKAPVSVNRGGPAKKTRPDYPPLDIELFEDLTPEQERRIAFSGEAIGRTLKEQIVISFILGNPTEVERTTENAAVRIESQRKRLEQGMQVLFGVMPRDGRRSVPDDVILFTVAQKLASSIAKQKVEHEKSRKVGTTSGRELPPKSVSKLINDTFEHYNPDANAGNKTAAFERIRKKFKSEGKHWLSVLCIIDFVTETSNFYLLEEIRQLLVPAGIGMEPVKWSDKV